MPNITEWTIENEFFPNNANSLSIFQFWLLQKQFFYLCVNFSIYALRI